jgi:predicted dehydrogenase
MTLSVAFYGVGERAQPYLEALGRRRDVQILGVCDLDRRSAEQVAAGWGSQVFLSYEAMLEQARPDALWVCVPPHLQGDVILRAAEQRIPFFVVPPGAVSFERARVYCQAVQTSGIVTAVGFPTRYTDVVREAREYLGTNPVPLALGWWLSPPHEAGTASATGVLWSEACLMLDALRCLCGEVVRVHAFRGGAAPDDTESAGALGTLVVHLEMARGGVGVLTLATFARPEPRIELELLGENWTLSFGRDLVSLSVIESDKTTTLRRLNQPAADHAAAFLDAVTRGQPDSESDYPAALQTLILCQAACRSAQEGRAISVAEV